MTTGCQCDMSQVGTDRTATMTATATTSTQLKGKAKDDPRWWNSYALVEQQQRRLVLRFFVTFNSILLGQSHGQALLSSLLTKASLPSLDARSRRQGSSYFTLQSSFLIPQHLSSLLRLSAFHLRRPGFLHTSRVGKDLGSGASGGPIEQMVGTS